MVSQWPVTRAPQKHFDVQARVAVCEHVGRRRGSHACGACVSSVFCTRVVVCEAQGGERGRGTRGRGSGERMRDRAFCPRTNFVPGQILSQVRCTSPLRDLRQRACGLSCLLPSRCPSGCAVQLYATDQRKSLPGAATHQAASANMGKNAHVRVPIYQQQQAMRVAAKQLVNEVSSPPASSPSEFVPAARAEFPATPPATCQPLFDISLKYPTAQHASTSQVGTWPESFYPRSHLPPTCTWAPPPERKCNGQGGGDHACAPAIDLATLLQLTAWIERLDAIMRANDGEDEVILNIRTRAVGVLDLWVQRWEV